MQLILSKTTVRSAMKVVQNISKGWFRILNSAFYLHEVFNIALIFLTTLELISSFNYLKYYWERVNISILYVMFIESFNSLSTVLWNPMIFNKYDTPSMLKNKIIKISQKLLKLF